MGNLVYLFLFLLSGLSLLADSNVYSWKEGDREFTVYLNPNYVAEIQSPKSNSIDKQTRIIPVTDAKIKSALAKGSLPKSHVGTHSEVFEEGVGGRKMTLPGDIYVEFDESLTEEAIKEWANNEKLILLTKLPGNKNIYRFKTEPGVQSLQLANSLLSKTGVKSAFPNWWREFSRR